MTILALTDLLAQLPAGTVYLNPWKLLAVALLFLGWVAFAAWVDKDSVRVNTFRQIWNMISLVVGSAGLLLLLFMPIFVAAIGAYAVVVGGFMIAYVVHRNGLVVPDDRVCTPMHFQRIMKEGFGKKKDKLIDVKERVRITAADRKVLKAPEEAVERQLYANLQEILYESLARRSGLIEMVPAGQVSKVRWTVDGVLAEREPLPRADADALLVYIKKLAGLNLEERRKPQKGKMNAQIGEVKFELIVRTDGSSAGENLNIRVFGDDKFFKVADIGFNPKQLDSVRQLMETEKGLLVLTAPPGGGLTTTVYSFARSHDAFLQNIQMVEREHEMDIDNITQRTWVPSDENPFSADLIKVIRSDPNVIFVPEVPDKASAVMTCDAAVKKQIVYVGIQATDLLDGLLKWITMTGDATLVSKALTAVLHQRLVRKLCTACKTPYKPDPATLAKINMPADKVLYRPPEPQFDKQGNPILCTGCQGSGYVGRTAVFTILTVDDDLRKVLRAGASPADVKAAVMKIGGLSLQQQALQKVFDGETSIDEVARATRAQPAAPAAAPAAKPRPAAPAAKPA